MCDSCDYESYSEKCEEMLDNMDYNFAEDTVMGIYDWVVENKHITDAQKKALDNIYNSKK